MENPVFTEVESSNIAAIAYTAGDPESSAGTLFIRFRTGTEYSYKDFPNQLAEDFFQADSVGKFFHANIRSQYPGEASVSDPEDISEVEKLQELGVPAELLYKKPENGGGSGAQF